MAAQPGKSRTPSGPGRPRLVSPRRSGETAREEILDAAAELFTRHGFTGTSTRMIAEAVGIRQASMYHYFATKDDLLADLLQTTVVASLQRARELVADEQTPVLERLLELARFDATQLAESRWNLGALYLLPEIGAERFIEFRAARRELANIYEAMAGQLLDDPADTRALLPFRLVESVIMMRADEQRDDLGVHTTAGLVRTIVGAIKMLLEHQP